MKKSRGFTLIELLIVTVVIATLMAIVFRLAGTGGESTARAKTLARLQKLSNALSGYYAAFGSYPPVPLQGRSRDIYTQVDSYGAKEEGGISGSLGYGIQGTGRNEAALESPEMRKQIEAACRAQPVAAGFPYNYKGTEVEVINALTTQYGLKSYQPIRSYGGFNKDSSDWSENNVFMFGLLSFLLPRYQFMLDGERNLYDMNHVGPWAANNRLPFLLDGTRLGAWSAANDPNDNAQSHLFMGPDNFGKTTSSHVPSPPSRSSSAWRRRPRMTSARRRTSGSSSARTVMEASPPTSTARRPCWTGGVRNSTIARCRRTRVTSFGPPGRTSGRSRRGWSRARQAIGNS